MAGKGGYQPPASPAPVSGPGSLSQRTDGQVQAVPTGMPYGDASALQGQESVAPLSATPNVPQPTPTQMGGAPPVPQPFDRPSERPDEPITQGVDIGPGAGSDILPSQHQTPTVQPGPMTTMLSNLSSLDISGILSDIYAEAKAMNA
jgi:hypothetical protein